MGWLGTFGSRIEITIPNTDSDLTNFPHLLYISASSGTGATDLTTIFDSISDANRKKIAVTTSDGTTQCYVEIENWDASGEKASLWVKVPSILASGGATLYLYFDAGQSDNTSYVGDTTDAVVHNVWDSNFKCVFHMNQSPTSATALKDSTSNGYQSTAVEAMDATNLQDGDTGKSIYYDGTAEYIGSNAPGVGGTNARTLEVYCDFIDKTTESVLVFYGTNANLRQWYFQKSASSGKLNVDTKSAQCYGTANMNNTGWNHVACVYPAGAGGNLNETLFFINGVSDALSSSASATINTGTATPLYFNFWGMFKGRQQEVRASDIERTVPWLKATAQSLADNLCAYGTFELGDIDIIADPIAIPLSLVGMMGRTYIGSSIPISLVPVGGAFVEGGLYPATPIGLPITLAGSYVEGARFSTDALIELTIAVNLTFVKSLRDAWIRANIDQVPFPLVEQVDKFGFLNNPNWSSQVPVQEYLNTIGLPIGGDNNHGPCGHWHKIPPIIYDITERTSIVSLLDTYQYSAEANSVLFDKNIISVNSNVVAVFHRGGTSEDFKLFTVGIDEDGLFTGTLDALTVQEDTQDNQGETRIFHVFGNVYACCYRQDNKDLTVKTVSIASDGTISAVIDTEIFVGASYSDWAKIYDNIFLVVYMSQPTLYGYVSSFGITNEGAISSFIDTELFESTYNLAYLNRISLTKWGDGRFIIANRQAVPPASDEIGMYLLACTSGGIITLCDSMVISSTGIDLTEFEPVSVGTTGKVGIKFTDPSSNLYFRVYDISSNAFGSYINDDPLVFKTAGAGIDYGMIHWNNDNWILAFTSTGAGPFNIGIVRLENNIIDTNVKDELYVVATGLNFNYADFCKINDNLAIVAYTGDDSHGWLASIEMNIFDARIKSILGSPILDEPVVWPMD